MPRRYRSAVNQRIKRKAENDLPEEKRCEIETETMKTMKTMRVMKVMEDVVGELKQDGDEVEG